MSCGDAAGSDQNKRLGRLPWRTLGLPDLRDGDGERLWYAVSNNFKKKEHTSCGNPADAGCLNSDSRGTITVRDASGKVVYDGVNPDSFVPSGAIAVIIAPGGVLSRQDTGAPQSRTAANVNNPSSYLDIALGEDNANLADGSGNGFISGPVMAGSNVIVNDRVAVISYQDLMPVLEKRVAHEVAACLDLYAAQPSNSNRYPLAADAINSGAFNNFSDVAGTRLGRVPDQPFTATCTSSAGTTCDVPPNPAPAGSMGRDWGNAACNLYSGLAWWTNWKLHVFYAMADAYKPNFPLTLPSCGSCLTVNLPAPAAPASGRKFVLMVAGKRLAAVAGGQPRGAIAELGNIANYLEGNNTSLEVLETKPSSTNFNDTVVYR